MAYITSRRQGGRLGVDGRDEHKLRECLLTLRFRAARAGRAADVKLIDDAIGAEREAVAVPTADADAARADLLRRLGRVPLTPRQWDALVAIECYWRSHGYAPCIEDIGAALGVSKISAYEHVQALVRKGAVRQSQKHHARSIVIADQPPLECPSPGPRKTTRPKREFGPPIGEAERQRLASLAELARDLPDTDSLALDDDDAELDALHSIDAALR